MRSIYLDHAATTPVAPEVAEAMRPFAADVFGNPSSVHKWGREARAALDESRDTIARAIHAEFSEIHFTSSGTEADNLAVIGAVMAAPLEGRRLVVSAIEHHAVLHAARFLQTQGVEVEILPVDREGRVDQDELRRALAQHTTLVSILHANNEIGTIQDVARLCKIVDEHGALFHTDAVQTFGMLPIHVGGIGCDLLSMSAHKMYGPKGVGALYIRSGTPVSPLIVGGAQEREKRAGTENVAGIVGFGKAVELAMLDREEEAARLTALCHRFIADLEDRIPGIVLNGPHDGRLPNNINVSIPGIDGPALLMNLDRAGIAASSGAACSSGSIEPSHVLEAIGLPPDLAAAGIRFSLGRSTSEGHLDHTVEAIVAIVTRMIR